MFGLLTVCISRIFSECKSQVCKFSFLVIYLGMAKFGVMCLEGEWEKALSDKKTVLPYLQLIESINSDFIYIHRRVATEPEFNFFIEEWTLKRYSDYKVLYISTHGFRGGINISRDVDVSLENFGEKLGERAEGRYVHLGGCSILKSNEDELKEFVKRTKIRGLMGYSKDIYWTESAAFEILLFETLRQYDGARNLAGYCKRYIEKEYPNLVSKLGFKFII